MSDPHGSKDVLMESADNVVLNKNHDITGSSFNNILLALFTLNAHAIKKPNVPGGLTSWKLLEETLYVMLSHIAKIEHILQRVFHLVLCDCFGQNVKMRGILAEGAVSFLHHWTTNYGRFISQDDFQKMNQLLESFLSHLLYHDATSNGRRVHVFSSKFQEILSGCSSQQDFEYVGPYFDAVVSGTWEQSSEKKSFLHGSLESIQQSKAIEMRNPNDSTPPVIAIFGITQDILDHSDDDDYNMPISLRGARPRTLLVDTPIVRIPTGFNMLQSFHSVNIWDFDVKEIARQWTLMDHAMFIAVPLVNLQCCQWTEARHLSKANEIRRFIDRFNAESCWVTQSLISQESSKSRAALYMKFVFLASFLEELNNFNGLMAILTALQQGCITRLSETLSYVDEKTKQTLKRLQILMSGSMNYKKYRDHLMDMMNDQELCVVPHMGAHLSEICSIEEGNSSYVQDASHLLNIDKLNLFCRCIMQVSKMQQRKYDLRPLQLVQLCLLSEFSDGQYLSSSEATRWSKNMFEKSINIEGRASSNNSSIASPRIEQQSQFLSQNSSVVEAVDSNMDKTFDHTKGHLYDSIQYGDAGSKSAGGDVRSSLL